MDKRELRKLVNQSKLGKEVWYVLHRINVNLMKVYSDEAYFKKTYKKSTGKALNLDNPKTFDEKQLWLKMNYRNPLCTTCSDKYLVREYVKEKGLEHILNPVYGAYDSFDEIEWDKLPDSFYMKANHTSGCNVRCNDKRTLDKKAARKKLNRGMRMNHYYESREWNYRDIDRKIVVEAILDDSEPLIDYRFLCCNGKCEYLFIDIDTADETGSHKSDAKRNVYDKDFNLMDIQVSRPRFDPQLVSKPDNFDEMLKYAEILSGDFPFCRVDLYNIKGEILFGEITFFHAGGVSKITPDEWAYKLGDLIALPELK